MAGPLRSRRWRRRCFGPKPACEGKVIPKKRRSLRGWGRPAPRRADARPLYQNNAMYLEQQFFCNIGGSFCSILPFLAQKRGRQAAGPGGNLENETPVARF